MHWIDSIASVIGGLAGLGAVWVAYRALATWRTQLKGQTRFESAKRLLVAANSVAQEFHAARSPVILAHEFPDFYHETLIKDRTPQISADAYKEVFGKRYERVHNACATVVGLLPEIKALFPEDVAEAAERFLDPPWELRFHMQMYADCERRGDLAGYPAEAAKRISDQKDRAREGVFAPPPRSGQPTTNKLTIEFQGKHEMLTEKLRRYLELTD